MSGVTSGRATLGKKEIWIDPKAVRIVLPGLLVRFGFVVNRHVISSSSAALRSEWIVRQLPLL